MAQVAEMTFISFFVHVAQVMPHITDDKHLHYSQALADAFERVVVDHLYLIASDAPGEFEGRC